jgi:hypothetical protein
MEGWSVALGVVLGLVMAGVAFVAWAMLVTAKAADAKAEALYRASTIPLEDRLRGVSNVSVIKPEESE